MRCIRIALGNGVKVKLFEETSGVSSSFIGVPLGLLTEFLTYMVTIAISSQPVPFLRLLAPLRFSVSRKLGSPHAHFLGAEVTDDVSQSCCCCLPSAFKSSFSCSSRECPAGQQSACDVVMSTLCRTSPLSESPRLSSGYLASLIDASADLLTPSPSHERCFG